MCKNNRLNFSINGHEGTHSRPDEVQAVGIGEKVYFVGPYTGKPLVIQHPSGVNMVSGRDFKIIGVVANANDFWKE